MRIGSVPQSSKCSLRAQGGTFRVSTQQALGRKKLGFAKIGIEFGRR